jgi:hypothetical protein
MMQDKSTCDETVVVLTCHADAAAPEVAAHPLAEEAYELTVSPSGIEISASTAAGVFYGMQSLIQLLPHRLDLTQEAGPFTIHLPALRVSHLCFPRAQSPQAHMQSNECPCGTAMWRHMRWSPSSSTVLHH